MIRIGIIGAGPNATGHGKYFSTNPRAKVVAVADPDAGRAATLAELCKATAMADYRQFLDQVDAVVISSPNFLHCEQAVAAAAAGKHVYCEKPMGINLEEARRIAGAVNDAKVRLTVGFSVRFDPTIQTALRLNAENRFGQLASIWSRRLANIKDLANPQGWRKDHRLSGGVLFEINIHELDWMMAMGGEVKSVFARFWAKDNSDPRNNDWNFVTINFAGGATGMHEGTWMASQPAYMRGVQGSEGGVTTDEWGGKLLFARLGQNREEMPLEPRYDIRGNFLDSIEHGAKAVADVNQGLKVMAVADAVFESARTGQVVAVTV